MVEATTNEAKRNSVLRGILAEGKEREKVVHYGQPSPPHSRRVITTSNLPLVDLGDNRHAKGLGTANDSSRVALGALGAPPMSSPTVSRQSIPTRISTPAGVTFDEDRWRLRLIRPYWAGRGDGFSPLGLCIFGPRRSWIVDLMQQTSCMVEIAR